MNAQPTRPRLVMTLLKERYYRVTPDCPAVCRLWKMRAAPYSEGGEVSRTEITPAYAIGMEGLTERYLYWVGSDEPSVLGFYDRITEGRLSPVHLKNAVEDYLWEREQEGKSKRIPETPLQTRGNMV